MTRQTDLAQLIAVRVSAPDHLEMPEFWSMATLIDPGTAVLPLHILPQAERWIHPKLWPYYGGPWVRPDLEAPENIDGTVIRRDKENDLALVETDSPPPISLQRLLPVDFLDSSLPPLGAHWESFALIPAAPEGLPIRGSVDGTELLDGRRYLRLRMIGPPAGWGLEQWRGISGAPVVVEGMLVGIIAQMHRDEPTFYALPPTSQIADAWRRALDEPLPPADLPPSPVATFSEQDFLSRLSPGAHNALAHAELVQQAASSRIIHVEQLVATLAYAADGIPARFIRSRQLSIRQLHGYLAQIKDSTLPLPLPPPLPSARLGTLPPHTAHLAAAFRNATRLADETTSAQIRAWHLLAGILAVPECTVPHLLAEHGIAAEPLVQYVERLEQPLPAPIAGYHNDQVGENDLLDVRNEALALASVIAARDVHPPISIGLFGEWGSGKTFFMSEMERSINRLVGTTPKGNGESPYCGKVVQIWFNSWHYIDTDLWASLTSEIFEGLANAYAPDDAETAEQTLHRLMDDTRRSTDLLAETRRNMEQAQQKLHERQEKLERLKSAEKSLELQLDTGTLVLEAVRYAAGQPEVQEKIRMAGDAIGDDTMKNNAGRFATELPEFFKEASRLRLLWSSLGSPRNRTSVALWMLSILIVVIAAIILLPLVMESSVWRAFATVATMILATLPFLLPALGSARKALAFIHQAQEARTRLIQKKRDEQEQELLNEQKTIQEQIERTEQQMELAKADLQASTEMLRKLSATSLLADFVGERDRSDDYRKHLGVITRSRNDFERLSLLMKKVREQNMEAIIDDPVLQSIPRVDRIILYIDDLDRCPQERVVQVLHAVHLLLAFDLFVVVVGVDPRWLLRALQQHSKIFDLDADHHLPDEEQSHWHSTPMNYLEKIFQIPFALRPMQRAGFGRMIDTLATPLAEDQPADNGAAHIPAGAYAPNSAESADPAHTGQHAEKATQTRAGNEGEAGDQQQRDIRPSATDQMAQQEHRRTAAQDADPLPDFPHHLAIEPWERECMKMFHEFIPSPRAAKRFVNIYRLLRASINDGRRESFIGNEHGGGYRAALLLLAIQTGHPEEGAEIIRALLAQQSAINSGLPGGNAERTWWEFIESLRTLCNRPWEESETTAARHQHRARIHAEGWRTLFRKLDALRTAHPMLIADELECADVIDWAPLVARYSFQSGRMLATRPATPSTD